MALRYAWRTREDGVILTRDASSPDAPETILTLSGALGEQMEKIEAQWGDLCRRIAGKRRLRDGWTQSMIRQESGGNARARNPERKPGPEDDGVGLLQITNAGLKGRHTDAELEQPEVNLEIGCAYMAHLVTVYGDDFPRIAAAFNAGSVHAPLKGYENPWNMHSSPGHISSEVMALNYFLLRPLSEADRAGVLAAVYSSIGDVLRHDLERGVAEPAPPSPRNPAA